MLAARSADEGIAINEEAQRQVRGQTNADARCHGRFPGRQSRSWFKPQLLAERKIPAVERAIDGQCSTQLPGSARQIPQRADVPPSAHVFDTLDRFERPQQYGRRLARHASNDIHAEVRVDRVHVCMADRSEHRGITGRWTAVAMGRRILSTEIRLDLNNDAALPSPLVFTHEQHPEQLPCNLDNIALEERAIDQHGCQLKGLSGTSLCTARRVCCLRCRADTET